jgi:hypothetical protein
MRNFIQHDQPVGKKKREQQVTVSRVLFRNPVAGKAVVTIRLRPPLPTPSSGLPAGSNEPPSSLDLRPSFRLR